MKGGVTRSPNQGKSRLKSISKQGHVHTMLYNEFVARRLRLYSEYNLIVDLFLQFSFDTGQIYSFEFSM